MGTGSDRVETASPRTSSTLAAEAGIAWQDVAGRHDKLAHRYFDTSHAIVQATSDHDVPALEAGIGRLLSGTALGALADC